MDTRPPSDTQTRAHIQARTEILVLLERLHRHKDAAYGDAWRKRGEVIAIFANMARKYDRLLVALDEQRPAATERLADTVADLCVYAGKDLTWIARQHPAQLEAAALPVAAVDISARRGADALQAVLVAAAANPCPAPGDRDLFALLSTQVAAQRSAPNQRPRSPNPAPRSRRPEGDVPRAAPGRSTQTRPLRSWPPGTLSAVGSRDHELRESATRSLLARLHRHKDAAYRDAWRKRGEVIGIFANIARKFDRLEVALLERRPTGAEPLGDTAADLCVYAGKYLTWLAETQPQAFTSSPPHMRPEAASAQRGPSAFEAVLDVLERWEEEVQATPPSDVPEAWGRVRSAFEQLEAGLMAQAAAGAQPDPPLAWSRKVELAWALTDAAVWLWERLAERDSSEFRRLRAEVEAMDERIST